MARALSKLGYCSRSRAAELIRLGHVSLNGIIRCDGETPVSELHDQIAVDGKPVEVQDKIYLMMNKPRGIVTTASDEKGRETVYAVLGAGKLSAGKKNLSGKCLPWLAPIGRLDKASEGLLLLTNDSQWGARVSDPDTHLEKTYHVQIATVADGLLVQSLIRGVKAEHGEILRAKHACLLRAGEKNCWVEIVLVEGKNRQIRRMMERIGVEVLRLVRVAVGPVQLGSLAKGEHRVLTTDEKRMLDRAMQRRAA